jgi:hypothetical protein
MAVNKRNSLQKMMSRERLYVVASSGNRHVGFKNPAVGNRSRVTRRFAGRGKYCGTQFLRYRICAGKFRAVFRSTYGWGTSDVSWFDYYVVG